MIFEKNRMKRFQMLFATQKVHLHAWKKRMNAG